MATAYATISAVDEGCSTTSCPVEGLKNTSVATITTGASITTRNSLTRVATLPVSSETEKPAPTTRLIQRPRPKDRSHRQRGQALAYSRPKLKKRQAPKKRPAKARQKRRPSVSSYCTPLKDDPGYQNGLSQLLQGRYTGEGQCPRCSKLKKLYHVGQPPTASAVGLRGNT